MRIPLVFLAPFALAACADDAGEPGDAAQSIAQTTPAPVARGDNEVAGVPDAEGNRWFYKAATHIALFGPSNSERSISMRCNLSLDDAAVAFHWLSAAQA